MADAWSLTLLVGDSLTVPVLPEHIPAPPGTVAETRRMRFRLGGDGFDPYTAELRVNDEPLLRQVEKEGNRLAVFWQWSPEFRAGNAVVELHNVGNGLYRRDIVVDPDHAKLERDEYEVMLLDILRDTAALADRAGCSFGVARGGRVLGIATLELIRSRMRRLEQAAKAVDRNPWRNVTRVRRRTTLGRAGALPQESLLGGLKDLVPVHPASASHLGPEIRSLADKLGGRLPGQISREVPTVNHCRREHADMLAAIGVIASLLSMTRAAIEAVPPSQRTAEQERLQAITGNLGRRVRRLTRLEVFRDVQPTKGPIRASHLFQRVPNYKQFYSTWREMRDGLADVVGDFLNVPLRRTYDLYEMWCYLRLAHAAAVVEPTATAWHETFREQVTNDGLVLQLETRPLDFGAFRMLFQPRYTEIWKSDNPMVGSFSRVMEPDISLELFGVIGTPPKPVVILDAKYRVEGAINDAITSTHMYRDALVSSEGPPYTDRRNLIKVALVLVPRMPAEFTPKSDWRRHSTPEVFFRQEYRETFGFGALVMTPGVDVVEVAAVLRGLMERTK